jgi:hypothetical protein
VGSTDLTSKHYKLVEPVININLVMKELDKKCIGVQFIPHRKLAAFALQRPTG